GRLLPRPQPSRRHPVRVRPVLLSLAGDPRAARPGRAGLSLADDGRLGVGPSDAAGGAAGGERARLLGRLPESPAGQRRILALAPARLVEGEGAAALGGQLGRAGPAPARQLRGLRALGLAPEVARGARDRAPDPPLQRPPRRAPRE